MSASAATNPDIAARARQAAPVVWLLGKVQSGKTSIIRELTQLALTRAPDAEIGSGFEACTKTARVFDFPSEAPILRFLDTRGLGEAAYDPADDIAFCEGRAHLLLAVMKARDSEQQQVLEVIRAARSRHPDWPVVVAQTTLHEGYPPTMKHIVPYPFAWEPWPIDLPSDLVRALAHQRGAFAALPGRQAPAFAPVDFTQAGDGFDPAGYGREALIDALIAAAPAAVAVALAELPGAGDDGLAGKLGSHILGFALAAGAGDAVPVAGVVAVPVVQAAMLQQLAKLCGATWDRRAYAEFAAALGVGTLVRTASSFSVRQLVKLVPVYGQTAGAAAAAAASFAATYAMGKAAVYFLTRRQQGRRTAEAASVYREALQQAFGLAKARDSAAEDKGAGKGANT